MTVTITPGRLSGAVTPPPSKSQTHRALIAAALAQGESVIQNVALSQDIQATIGCLRELGAEFAPAGDTLAVRGIGANAAPPMARTALPRLDCGESGSTLRFLIPVALAVRGGGIFTGRGRLMERPQGPYAGLFREKGVFFEQKDGVLTAQGSLAPGEYRLSGGVSSQFFTGLLYALPLLDGPSALIPTTPLESEGYVAMTLAVLGQFGVELDAALSLPPQWHTPGRQTYRPARVTVEADWSQAGFWYAARALGSGVEVTGMNAQSLQGDKVIADHFVTLCRPGDVEIDVSQCPDLAPALALMAAVRKGTARIVNAGRLRIKESDRLAAVAEELGKLGARIAEGPDSLAVEGVDSLKGGAAVDAHNDHRVAMMLAVAATRCDGPITLTGAESVNKSYPDFWEEYRRLGGKIAWNT